MADILLYESPIGYALFKVNQSEEISNSEQFQKSMANYAKFSKYCSLHAFVEFQTSEELLENINAISEGGLHDTLKNFLSENIKKETLGTSAINESLKITCTRGKQVGTLVRGVRTHFTHFLKDVNDGDIRKAMLGLGHSYSRNKLFSFLINLKKDMNTFTMRIKEWYSWHFPELYNILSNDNTKFVKSVLIIQNRNSLDDNKKQQLVEVTDEDTADRIVASANASMGFDVNEFDLQNINTFAKRVTELYDYKQSLEEYLHSKMTTIAPNLTALIGDAVGARLLSKAGSLTNLAKYPASTLQILGAEKALFRAIKTRGNTPKYGVIFASSFIGKADSKNKGRISRFLANKASVASRIDCFGDVQTSRFGEVMKDQVEERLEFLKSGKVPQTNVDVMKTVMEEVAEQRNKDIDEDENENESNSSDNSSSEETSGSDSSSE
ncbi:Nucleolar protein 56 [Entamoeba marina]